MSTKAKSLLLAFIVSTFFLLLTVFSSSSAFNFLPYLIHQSFSPGGEGESEFIKVFDIVFAIVLFFISYKISKRLFGKREA